jgi:phosphoesterase RecJ-like protein
MLNYGAQLPRIVQNTYQNKDLASMKIWGLALKNLKINSKYNLAVSVLPRAEINEAVAGFGAEISSDIFGDIVGFLSNLGGVKGVLLLREENAGRIKGNFRSADLGADMSRLAQIFGGGGHPQASGILVKGKIVKKNDGWNISLD